MSKRLSKYIASFDYCNNPLIVLFATSSGISIASFATAIGALAGMVRASFSLVFSMSAGIVKKLLKQHKIKRKSIIELLY